mmetsp:Transcript_6742/g.19646  ORF Transcript_6742/g.19646 Transcript_6742/m.19646 type:complete len:265 (+) Transcript_6742:175-969(+)
MRSGQMTEEILMKSPEKRKVTNQCVMKSIIPSSGLPTSDMACATHSSANRMTPKTSTADGKVTHGSASIAHGGSSAATASTKIIGSWIARLASTYALGEYIPSLISFCTAVNSTLSPYTAIIVKRAGTPTQKAIRKNFGRAWSCVSSRVLIHTIEKKSVVAKIITIRATYSTGSRTVRTACRLSSVSVWPQKVACCGRGASGRGVRRCCVGAYFGHASSTSLTLPGDVKSALTTSSAYSAGLALGCIGLPTSARCCASCAAGPK